MGRTTLFIGDEILTKEEFGKIMLEATKNVDEEDLFRWLGHYMLIMAHSGFDENHVFAIHTNLGDVIVIPTPPTRGISNLIDPSELKQFLKAIFRKMEEEGKNDNDTTKH